ncbi:hypothetical protein OHAE_1390 [Ochrobactrum soli]|uniref:Uncharacterized protein n=1 Tax=Ochrobactrum soli TaxID=2448455 RepID=A0A2P9HNC0_9HYPH|nr:hypothetical protein OHAE_1390 [[Ochrobactrum] soli]
MPQTSALVDRIENCNHAVSCLSGACSKRNVERSLIRSGPKP